MIRILLVIAATTFLPTPAFAAPPRAPSPLADSAWAHLGRRLGPSFIKYVAKDTVENYSEPEPPPEPKSSSSTRKITLARSVGPSTPAWTFLYTFKIPEKPWVQSKISVTVDLQGRLAPSYGARGVIPGSGIWGIGDCAHDSTLCQFPINREAAIRIARDNGLHTGLASWMVQFTWHAAGRFVWGVSNTERVEADSCSSSGTAFLIDANTGAVFQRSGWNRVCDHF